MPGLLQESDIRVGLQAGGRIEGVVIVARRDEAGGVEHVPYLLPSWRRGYVAIGLFRGPGIRAYRDLTRLVRFLREDLGFHGSISLHEENSPQLGKIRSFVGATTGRSGPQSKGAPEEDDTGTSGS